MTPEALREWRKAKGLTQMDLGAIDGADDLNGAQADITDARLDYDHGIEPIADLESLYHVAVRIAVRK